MLKTCNNDVFTEEEKKFVSHHILMHHVAVNAAFSVTYSFPSLDRVSGTLCLLHYVTETSYLYSLRDF